MIILLSNMKENFILITKASIFQWFIAWIFHKMLWYIFYEAEALLCPVESARKARPEWASWKQDFVNFKNISSRDVAVFVKTISSDSVDLMISSFAARVGQSKRLVTKSVSGQTRRWQLVRQPFRTTTKCQNKNFDW